MVLGSPAQRRLPTLAPHSDPISAREIAVARLEQVLLPVLLRAEKANITLCLEPLPPPEADFITTLQEAVDIVKRLQHPHLKTILDVKSASNEQESISTLLRDFAPYIAHVHANDANSSAQVAKEPSSTRSVNSSSVLASFIRSSWE